MKYSWKAYAGLFGVYFLFCLGVEVLFIGMQLWPNDTHAVSRFLETHGMWDVVAYFVITLVVVPLLPTVITWHYVEHYE